MINNNILVDLITDKNHNISLSDIDNNIINYTDEIIVLVDLNLNIKYSSQNTYEYCGFSNEEYTKLSLNHILESKSYLKLLDLLNSKCNDKSNIEIKHIHKNNHYIWSDLKANCIYENRDNCIGYLLVLKNIEKHKSNEEKLEWLNNCAISFLKIKNEDDIYQFIGDELVEKIQDSIIILGKINPDEDKIIIHSIKGIENKIFNLLNKKFKLNPVHKSYDFVSEFKEIYKKQTLTEFNGDLIDFNQSNYSKTLLKKLTKLFNINKIYTIGLRQNDKLFAAVHIITKNKKTIEDIDIIETFFNQVSVALQRNRLENNLIKAKLKAEESDNLKSAFLTNLSHEIRTPMNGIIGFSNLLRNDELSNTERNQYLSIIEHNTSRLLKTISCIMEISKIQTNQVDLKISSININEFLKEIFDKYDQRISTDNIGFKLNIPKNSNHISIKTDSEKLSRVFENLLDNAIKYTKNGFIEIGYKIINQKIVFFVHDTGIGIPKKKQKDIFRLFYQVNPSLTSGFEGSGLGLTITLSYLELLGATYKVNSEENKGLKLKFTMPDIIS